MILQTFSFWLSVYVYMNTAEDDSRINIIFNKN